ncbi:hypothetical protein DSO57_1005174 [Entomophthora muscae]|uniref:Uncharacterized protein n=1 Tax=Entomophthora muscae TaxID=34485 RepID=A0ACC2TV41_9FUNG|nr:hypothetical protein DSO57_1005174 [Entomophthora muscae]
MTHVFPISFNATGNVTIKKFLFPTMALHLRSVGGQLAIEDSNHLQAILLKANHLNPPLKSINNPRLSLVKFNDMDINYKSNDKIIKVLVASKEKELSNQENVQDSNRSKSPLDPKMRKLIKLYFTSLIPLAIFFTVLITLYLK